MLPRLAAAEGTPPHNLPAGTPPALLVALVLAVLARSLDPIDLGVVPRLLGRQAGEVSGAIVHRLHMEDALGADRVVVDARALGGAGGGVAGTPRQSRSDDIFA